MTLTPRKKLKQYNLSTTKPRMAILEYLMSHHTHPTCETIYNDLIGTMPTLSLTTVYNTVRCLAECGAIQVINIDEKSICADENTFPHAHFLCSRCKKIYDLPFNKEIEHLTSVEGHKVEEIQLYYRGICKNCKEN